MATAQVHTCRAVAPGRLGTLRHDSMDHVDQDAVVHAVHATSSNRRPADYESVPTPPPGPVQTYPGCSGTGPISSRPVLYRLVATPGLPQRLPAARIGVDVLAWLAAVSIRSQSDAHRRLTFRRAPGRRTLLALSGPADPRRATTVLLRPGLTSPLRCCRASEPAGLRPGRSSAPAGNRPTKWTWTPSWPASGPCRSTCWPSRRSTGHRPGESSLTLPGAALSQALKAHRWCPRPSRRSRLHQAHAFFHARGPAQILVTAAPSAHHGYPRVTCRTLRRRLATRRGSSSSGAGLRR
jgi:hypothetical protein